MTIVDNYRNECILYIGTSYYFSNNTCLDPYTIYTAVSLFMRSGFSVVFVVCSHGSSDYKKFDKFNRSFVSDFFKALFV